MSGPAATITPKDRPGRNDPCPCGSGRKFKLCCGAERLRGRETGGGQSPPPAAAASKLGAVGPLTEASKIREEAERFRQMQSALPAGLLAGGPSAAAREITAQRQIMAAERHRQRGVRLFASGKLSAAIAALSEATRLCHADAGSHHLLGRAFLRSGRLEEAAASLRLAVTLNDGLAAAHYDLALALDRQDFDLEAMAAYRQAVTLAPDLAEGHSRLGELLEAAGDVGEAAQSYRRAAAAAPETPPGRLNAVRALRLEGSFREAETLAQQAIALDPGDDLLYHLLADSLSKQGRFEEAIEACDRALAMNPSRVSAHLAAVQARKCTEADRPRLEWMRASLRDAAFDDGDRVFLHFAIGKLLDDLGEYQEAMRHLDEGNSIKRRHLKFDRQLFSGHVDAIMRRFTPAFFADNADFAADDETPLLIIGMPRSGTTLVEQILSSHPRIVAGGELLFWTKRAASWGIASAAYLTPASGRELSADYLALLRRIGPAAARVTDKVPFNLFQLGLIHLLLPKARIVHCRRHPVDTCLSMYFTHFAEKFEFACDKADLAFVYRRYVRLMEHWRTALPPERFLEVDYETLIADREAVTRRLVAFSGLDWHDACMTPERNQRAVTTSSVWQVRQPVYTTSIERWRRYEPWIGELRQLLPAAGAAAARSRGEGGR